MAKPKKRFIKKIEKYYLTENQGGNILNMINSGFFFQFPSLLLLLFKYNELIWYWCFIFLPHIFAFIYYIILKLKNRKVIYEEV